MLIQHSSESLEVMHSLLLAASTNVSGFSGLHVGDTCTLRSWYACLEWMPTCTVDLMFATVCLLQETDIVNLLTKGCNASQS